MQPKRQKVLLAFVGSLILHAVALLVFALIVALRPPALPETPPPDEPVKLEVAEEEPPTPPPIAEAPSATPTPTPRLVIDATGEDSTDTPSPDAILADRTTRASSAEAADNDRPGAAQTGSRLASFQFDPAPPAPGVVSRAEPVAPTPLPQTAPALPQPDRFVQQTPPPRQTPASTPLPRATPAPTAAPDEFAMAMATPTPPLVPEDPFDPSIRSTSPPLPKPAAKPTPTPPVGSMRSAENGGGVPRGPGGVDTLATPSARYARQASNMIQFIWGRSIESRTDLSYGVTVIQLYIDKDGLVLNPRVASNTSDTMLASIALQAVVVARLPAMPPDVVQELGGGRLLLSITFDYLPLPQQAAQR